MGFQFPSELVEKAAVELKVEVPVVKAVIKVESAGDPFLAPGTTSPRGLDLSGKPLLQFEGHVFWNQLKALHLSPQNILKDPSTVKTVDATGRPIGEMLLKILYPKYTKKYIERSAKEWDQLTAARAISAEAANKSASWGAFQIMGFNHKQCGYNSISEFLTAAETVEGQTDMFVCLLKNSPSALKALKVKNWAAFAKIYNGPGYAVNDYDGALARAYRSFRQ